MLETVARSQIPEKDTWNLKDLFETEIEWEAAFAAAQEKLKLIAGFEGRLGDRDTLLRALDACFGALRTVDALFCYARMRRDEDNRVTGYQALCDRAQALAVRLDEQMSFVRPELLEQDDETLIAYANDPAFAQYDFYLREIVRMRPHTMSKEAERIAAMAGEVCAAPDTVYTLLTDADMRFPEIDAGGAEKIKLTQSNYVPTLMTQPRPVRKATFEAFYQTFKGYSATIPALYAASVKGDLFHARCAGFDSARAASLFSDAIPERVYDSLIEETRRHIPALADFLRVNARVLGLNRLAMYDLYVPACRDFAIELPFDEAYDLVVDCLKPLGDEYCSALRMARAQRWIDPYENVGKHSGAYSWGAYDSHPYVLLNYHEDLHGLLTIAHEMGHAMHTRMSNAAQPFAKADYSMFVAEVASTVNEVLTVLELLERHPERDAQAYLLYNLLDGYRTTLFRQTMFAEFERESHFMAQRGEALTDENLSELYAGLNRDYYPDCEQDELIRYEWMRIPHFYRAFYVYVYATGFSAATALAATIRAEGESAAKRYKDFLSAGGSMHPIDALKLAGIDMASPEPVKKALTLFEDLLARYKAAVNG